MTDDKIALREVPEKGSDATFLREMIGFAAQRLLPSGRFPRCLALPWPQRVPLHRRVARWLHAAFDAARARWMNSSTRAVTALF